MGILFQGYAKKHTLFSQHTMKICRDPEIFIPDQQYVLDKRFNFNESHTFHYHIISFHTDDRVSKINPETDIFNTMVR